MEEKLEKIFNIKTVLSAMIFALCFVGLVGFSWAFFQQTLDDDNAAAKSASVTTGTLSITYNGGPQFSFENALPGQIITKTFTVQNTGDAVAKYKIVWNTLTNGFVDKTDLVYSISSNNSGGTLSQTQMPNTINAGSNALIINNISIAKSVTQTYTMTIKFLNQPVSQNDNVGKSVSGKINVIGIS